MQQSPLVAVMRQLTRASRRGACVLRPQGPCRIIWLVVLVHATVGGLVMLWAFLISREWDAIYLLLVAAIVMHWIVFKGECIISVLEKHLMYVDYRMGDAPFRQWYFELFSERTSTSISVMACTGLCCGITSVLWRNIRTKPHSISLDVVWPPGAAPA